MASFFDNHTMVPFPSIHIKVEQESETIELSPGSTEHDPDWTYVDKAGHGHFTRKTPNAPDPFPTLRWVGTGCTMGHGEECDAEGYWECPQCDERIQPGLRAATPQIIRHRPRVEITAHHPGKIVTYNITEKRWKELGGTLCDVIYRELQEYVTNVVVEG
jgi:hypothetical protein